MNKRIEPELPSIMPDIDQVEDFKRSRSKANNSLSQANEMTAEKAAPVKTASGVVWLGAVAIITFAAGGYALYQQNLATQAQLTASELRIAELERALSATGEEMGESAGAIRAKLTTLTERTDELWTQMDKLWASAWRRNQAEIKKLKEQTSDISKTQTQQNKTQSNATASIETLSQSQTELTLKLSLLQEQQQTAEALKSQLTSMNTDLGKLKSQSQGRDAKQLEIGGSIAQLEMTQNALAEQLERLESRLASAAQTQQSTE